MFGVKEKKIETHLLMYDLFSACINLGPFHMQNKKYNLTLIYFLSL